MKRFTEEEVQAIKGVFNNYYDDTIFDEVSSELIKTNDNMGFNESWAIRYGETNHELIFSNQDLTGEYPNYIKRFPQGTTVYQICQWLEKYMIRHNYV